MNRKRNHYIPQFLLRRFSADTNEKGKRLWQFRSGAPPVHVGTKDAAVSSYFYGQPDTGVEDAFASLEGEQAALLRDLDAGQDPVERSRELRALTWSMAFRTRALRGHFAAIAERGIEQMKSVGDDTLSDALRREIANNLGLHIEDSLEGASPEVRDAVREFLSRPGASDAMTEFAIRKIPELAPLFSVALDHAGGAVQQAASHGHVEGLVRMFAEGKRVPDKFQVSSWTVQCFDPCSVVLGDGIVFATGPDGQLGMLGKYTDNYSAVYLPIAHDRVLIGKGQHEAPVLSLGEINTASVQLALDTFFSPSNSGAQQELVNEIGTREPLLTGEELAEIVDDSWSSLGEARGQG